MRKTSEVEGRTFPYGSPLIGYLLVYPDGRVYPPNGVGEKREAVEFARDGAADLYAAWPGQHRTDVFLVDDFEMAAWSLLSPVKQSNTPRPPGR